VRVSVVIRTYNEQRHLDSVLRATKEQDANGIDKEVLVVDSGSTDATKDIAHRHGAVVTEIAKDEFTFGRALNVGCARAGGEYLVFVSGHCVPASGTWLKDLVRPLVDRKVAYSYGRQLGNGESRFSECQLFRKYFPEHSAIPQSGFFCNNANAALPRSVWEEFRFNEELTGLEDMELGKRLVQSGQKLGYVASAPVYHIHDESWTKVRVRYEREAVALQSIMPEIHLKLTDVLRYFVSGVLYDSAIALQQRRLHGCIAEIVMFRLMQYWGAYRGNHFHRVLSKQRKEKYFYPK